MLTPNHLRIKCHGQSLARVAAGVLVGGLFALLLAFFGVHYGIVRLAQAGGILVIVALALELILIPATFALNIKIIWREFRDYRRGLREQPSESTLNRRHAYEDPLQESSEKSTDERSSNRKV